MRVDRCPGTGYRDKLAKIGRDELRRCLSSHGELNARVQGIDAKPNGE